MSRDSSHLWVESLENRRLLSASVNAPSPVFSGMEIPGLVQPLKRGTAITYTGSLHVNSSQRVGTVTEVIKIKSNGKYTGTIHIIFPGVLNRTSAVTGKLKGKKFSFADANGTSGSGKASHKGAILKGSWTGSGFAGTFSFKLTK